MRRSCLAIFALRFSGEAFELFNNLNERRQPAMGPEAAIGHFAIEMFQVCRQISSQRFFRNPNIGHCRFNQHRCGRWRRIAILIRYDGSERNAAETRPSHGGRIGPRLRIGGPAP